MNFQTILEELDRLYDESITEAVNEEAVKEQEEEEVLTEAAEDAAEEEPVVEEEAPAEEETVAEEASEEVVTEDVQFVVECANCGAVTIKAQTDVKVDEEADLVNLDEACQYCEEAAGYKILGTLAPYAADEIEAEEAEDEIVIVDDVVEEE